MLDSGDSGRIDYDEKAIMSLLDRNSSHDDAPDEEKDMMANEYLASFKVNRKLLITTKCGLNCICPGWFGFGCGIQSLEKNH